MFDFAVTSPVEGIFSQALPAVRHASSTRFRVPVASVWPRLMSGELVIVDHTTDVSHCSLTLQQRPTELRVPLTTAQRLVVEQLLAGVAQKVVGYAISRGASTVCGTAASAVRALGLRCTTKRVPLALVVLAAAHRVPSTPVVAECRTLIGVPHAFELELPHPHKALPATLSPAEHHVARLTMDGLSHTAIAAQRGRSARTVANQMHCIFNKLLASNRHELINNALTHGYLTSGRRCTALASRATELQTVA
jgi:DNA-binding CsgD family transcriptional regulator